MGKSTRTILEEDFVRNMFEGVDLNEMSVKRLSKILRPMLDCLEDEDFVFDDD